MKMNKTEIEIKKVEKVLSNVKGKAPYEVPINLINDLYNFSFSYLELLKELKNRTIKENEPRITTKPGVSGTPLTK